MGGASTGAPDNLASKRQMRKAKRKSRKEARSKVAQKMEQSLQQADVRDSEKTAGSKEDGSLSTQAAVPAPTAKPHFCAMCGTLLSGGKFCAGCGAPVVAAGAKAAEAKAAGAKKTKRKSGKKGKREKSSHTASGREEAL